MDTQLSEADLAALPNAELIEVWLRTFPEPTDYGRAWYRQRSARDRLLMRTQSLRELVNASIDESLEGVLAVLELDRRARNAGFVRTGQWIKAQLENPRPSSAKEKSK